MTESSFTSKDSLEPACFGNERWALRDKLFRAPPPIDGEWLPKSVVYALVDLMAVIFGHPKGLFKDCAKRIQSGMQIIQANKKKNGCSCSLVAVQKHLAIQWRRQSTVKIHRCITRMRRRRRRRLSLLALQPRTCVGWPCQGFYLKCRRISYPRSDENQDQPIAKKGNFIVYTNDGKRFIVPLEYLSRNVFTELLRMAEEEFSLPSHGANTLPCDSTMFEYVILLIGRWIPEELEKALLTSIASCHQLASSSSSLAQGQIHQQQLIFRY